MRINRLQAQCFRNLREVEFCPGPGANIIYGDNAQGKTNLLEAIWLFTGGKSFRGGKDSEMVLFGEDNAALTLEFDAGQREQTSNIYLGAGKKGVYLNEIKQSGSSALTGSFCAVVFSPDHLSLIKQGPEKRRRLIDISLCQAYPKYMRILDSYNKALRQRGFLLRDIERHPELAETLEIWDNVIADYGSYISWMRSRYTAKLGEYAAAIYSGIASGKEQLEISYGCSFDDCAAGKDRAQLKEMLAAQLQGNREADIRSGVTSAGPHRDDLDIRVGGKSARSFGSQGQQRSCILALKLAECGILEERNHEPPVVLLDDVMSELDENRRGYLLNHLENKQVLITCCDMESFSELRQGTVFYMESGTVSSRQ